MSKSAGARRLARALAAACAVLAFTVSPTASGATFGYGDNRPDLFTDQRWQALPLKDVRRTVDWDVQQHPDQVAALDTWMSAAQTAGARPLIAIDRSWTNPSKTKRPTVKQYSALISWLKGRYPWWNTLTPWNEANYHLQPTAKDPRAAFDYWVAAKKACKGCTVTSPAILAGKVGVSKSFIESFKKLAKGKVKLWAIHVYGDQNRRNDKGLRDLERALPGKLWVTETAAWVKFGAKPEWKYDEARAARVIDYVFATAKKHPRVLRWYFWQWLGDTDPQQAQWDSGVLNSDGTERLGYGALVKGLGG